MYTGESAFKAYRRTASELSTYSIILKAEAHERSEWHFRGAGLARKEDTQKNWQTAAKRARG